MGTDQNTYTSFIQLNIRYLLIALSFLMGAFTLFCVATGNKELATLNFLVFDVKIASSGVSGLAIVLISIAMFINGKSKWSPVVGLPVMFYALACLASSVFANHLLYIADRWMYGPPSQNALILYLCLSVSLWYKRNESVSRWADSIALIISGGTILGYISARFFGHDGNDGWDILGVGPSGLGLGSALPIFMLSLVNTMDAFRFKISHK